MELGAEPHEVDDESTHFVVPYILLLHIVHEHDGGSDAKDAGIHSVSPHRLLATLNVINSIEGVPTVSDMQRTVENAYHVLSVVEADDEPLIVPLPRRHPENSIEVLQILCSLHIDPIDVLPHMPPDIRTDAQLLQSVVTTLEAVGISNIESNVRHYAVCLCCPEFVAACIDHLVRPSIPDFIEAMNQAVDIETRQPRGDARLELVVDWLCCGELIRLCVEYGVERVISEALIKLGRNPSIALNPNSAPLIDPDVSVGRYLGDVNWVAQIRMQIASKAAIHQHAHAHAHSHPHSHSHSHSHSHPHSHSHQALPSALTSPLPTLVDATSMYSFVYSFIRLFVYLFAD